MGVGDVVGEEDVGGGGEGEDAGMGEGVNRP